MKLVIDLVGKKRFTNILDSGKDLKTVKKIIRRKINQASSSEGNVPLEAKFKPHVGQGAWWSTRYMDEVQTESAKRSTRTSPRSRKSPRSPTNNSNNYSRTTTTSPRSPTNNNNNNNNNKSGNNTTALAEYEKWMRVAQKQKMNAHAMQAPFVGGGRRQTYFSNMRDGHNDKMIRINSAGKDAIIKAAEAYKKANQWD